MFTELGFEGRFKVQTIRGLPFPSPESPLTITGTPKGASPRFTIDLGGTCLNGVYQARDRAVTGRYGELGTFHLTVRPANGADRSGRRLFCLVKPRGAVELEIGRESGSWTADEDDP